MAAAGRGTCNAVAPLLARYNDPDLSEKERVLLSTHLLNCPQCLARLQEYRALDRRVRTMPAMFLSAQARSTVLDRVAAASAPALSGTAFALPWRQNWPGAVVACSLAAMLLVTSFAALNFAQQVDGRLVATAGATDVLARPLANSLLSANPTRVAAGVSERMVAAAAVQAPATRPAAQPAVIRAIYAGDGRLVVAMDGAGRDERIVVTRDTAFLFADGHPASVANLAPGMRVQLHREQLRSGITVALEVIIPR